MEDSSTLLYPHTITIELNFIKFQVGGIDFGIPVDEVQEVVPQPRTCPLPRSLPYIKGAFELRGKLVLLVDLRRRFGLDGIKPSRDTHVIVVNLASGFTGMLVESISDIKRISKEYILPPIPLAGLSEDLLKGIYLHEDEVILLPDFNKIFFSFIRIQLSPIDLISQIAFRYKLGKGLLSHVLEEIQMNQKALFSIEQIRALARSMDLPATQLFKITSFYNHFRAISSQISSLESSKGVRTGDQKYLQLFLRLEEEKRKSKLDVIEMEPEESWGIGEWEKEMDDSGADLLKLWAKKLPITFYRDLARKAHVPTIRLARFISFYKGVGAEAPGSIRGHASLSQPIGSRYKALTGESLQELLPDENLTLSELLHAIRDKQGYITVENVRCVSQARKVPTTRIYNLVSVLYGAASILKTESLTNNLNKLDNPSGEEFNRSTTPIVQKSREWVLSSLCKKYRQENEGLPSLLDNVKKELGSLSLDEVRYLASSLDVPNARLHHLLSYYECKCSTPNVGC